MQIFDAIVAGVGGMGSAAAYHLARRGQRVLGLERFDIPNQMGSSGGSTRIIRRAYYEHPMYVPLLRRAFELWRELEAEAARELLFITGAIDAGPPDSPLFTGSLASCQRYGLAHDVLTAAQLAQRFPAYRLPDSMLSLYQPDGGFLASERCIVAHVEAAQAHGADIRARERVLGWEARGGRVRVTSDRGEYETAQLIVSPGAWIGDLVPALGALAVPERQVLGWFQPLRPEWFTPEAFPVFNVTVVEGDFYGLPVFDVPGFKFGRHHHRLQNVDAETYDREPDTVDEQLLRDFAERYFPAGAGTTMALKTCLYTNTPDEHFIIDRHPQHPEVVLASVCSGHGFKFCSVAGEIVADLCVNGATRHDIELFRLSRFAATH